MSTISYLFAAHSVCLISAASADSYVPFIPTETVNGDLLLLGAYAATALLLSGFCLRLHLAGRGTTRRLKELKSTLKRGGIA